MTANSEFTVRRATIRDMELLVSQRHKMLQEIPSRKATRLRGIDSSYRKWLKYMLRKRRIVCFLAINKLQEPIGGGCVWIRDVPPSPWTGPGLRVPYLMSMYTNPNWRGRGIASAIVKNAMDWSRKMKYSRMTLHASEAGRSIYRKLGWTRTWEMRVELSQTKISSAR